MGARIRRHSGAGRGARLARPALLTMMLLVFLLLVPATASAHVTGKYRYRYKTKLTYYRNMMDGYSDTNYVDWKQQVESLSNQIRIALEDQQHPENVKLLEQSALDQRTILQGGVVVMRDNTYADIAKFKAKAVDWFAKKADRNRFKAGLTTLRGGFTTLFSADEGLMKAFSCLGMNADVGGCANEVMAADMERTTAETSFDKGWKQLLALQ
jgi:hypothetical protein